MATTHPVGLSASQSAFFPPDPEFPAGGEGANASMPDASETSPLLRHKQTPRRNISEWWKSSRSSFFEDNLGLLLVAASQFFFSAMNVSVKWLNSSDEPVPTLEVCLKRPE